MSALPERAYTEAEYLDLDRSAVGQKFCFNDGHVFEVGSDAPVDMAGGSPDHSLIASNVGTALNNALRGRPYRVFNSDLRVRAGSGAGYFYPDVTVVCGEPEFFDGDTLANPLVIVEVVSPTTEAFDRGRKFDRYAQIASLAAYVLIDARGARVDVFERLVGEDAWRLTKTHGLGGTLRIGPLGVEVALGEVYRLATFAPDEEP